jgi:hypothetical protein
MVLGRVKIRQGYCKKSEKVGVETMAIQSPEDFSGLCFKSVNVLIVCF